MGQKDSLVERNGCLKEFYLQLESTTNPIITVYEGNTGEY